MSWSKALSSVTGLVSEFIEDPDKKAQIQLEVRRLEAEVRTALLNTTTTPGTDAFVKILIAFRDIILPLLRPIGAACMTTFAAYCTLNDVALSETLQAVLYGAFPGWGVSRHVNKQTETKARRRRERYDDDIEDFDIGG